MASLILRSICCTMLTVLLFHQFILQAQTSAPIGIGNNQLESTRRVTQELDCYRLKLVLKSLTLRIRRLEMEAFGAEKLPYELAEIESWCYSPEMAKRNFDEIDRSGFRGFSKKNFDEIDKSGFRGFTG